MDEALDRDTRCEGHTIQAERHPGPDDRISYCEHGGHDCGPNYPDTVDEARFTEIEATWAWAANFENIETMDSNRRRGLLFQARSDTRDLLAEVRRLKKAVDQAYNDGESSGHADIVGIIGDPMAGDDASSEEILAEIKQFLGVTDG